MGNNNKYTAEEMAYRASLNELQSQMDSAGKAGVPLLKYKPFVNAQKKVAETYAKLEKKEGVS